MTLAADEKEKAVLLGYCPWTVMSPPRTIPWRS